MDLRRSQAGAVGVFHRLDHVGDEAANVRSARVGHRFGALQQDGMTHAGDLENGHGTQYGQSGSARKALAAIVVRAMRTASAARC